MWSRFSAPHFLSIHFDKMRNTMMILCQKDEKMLQKQHYSNIMYYYSDKYKIIVIIAIKGELVWQRVKRAIFS